MSRSSRERRRKERAFRSRARLWFRRWPKPWPPGLRIAVGLELKTVHPTGGDHRCGHPQAPCARCETITAAQIRLPPAAVVNRTRGNYRRNARWWELEAARGYRSAWRSRVYARTLRWCSELAGIYGDGTFPELLARSGYSHPYPKGLPDTEAEWMADPAAGNGATGSVGRKQWR